MNLRKVLNWYGFTLCCSGVRAWFTVCRRGPSVVYRKTSLQSYLNIISPSLRVCTALPLPTPLHHDPNELLKLSAQASIRHFQQIESRYSQKKIKKESRVPGQIKQVSARMSILNPRTALRQAALRRKKLQAPSSGQHREEWGQQTNSLQG